MSQRAHITSSEAIEQFRSQLIVYVAKARPAIEEVSAEMVRLRNWLENDQRIHWEGQFRRRTKELEEAQSALFSARIGNLRKETSAEFLQVQRCKRALEDVENKLRAVKHWSREFEHLVAPLLKQTEKVHTVLSSDLVQGIAHLNQVITTLAAYAEAGGAATISPQTGSPEISGTP